MERVCCFLRTALATAIVTGIVFSPATSLRAQGDPCYGYLDGVIVGDHCKVEDPDFIGVSQRAYESSARLFENMDRRRSGPPPRIFGGGDARLSPGAEYIKALGPAGFAARLTFKPRAPILPDRVAAGAPANQRHAIRKRIGTYLDAYKTFHAKGLSWGNTVHPHMLYVEMLYNVATGDRLTTPLAAAVLRAILQEQALFGAVGDASDRDKQVIAELYVTVAFDVFAQWQEATHAHDARKMERLRALARRLLIRDTGVDPKAYRIDAFACGVDGVTGSFCSMAFAKYAGVAAVPPPY